MIERMRRYGGSNPFEIEHVRQSDEAGQMVANEMMAAREKLKQRNNSKTTELEQLPGQQEKTQDFLSPMSEEAGKSRPSAVYSASPSPRLLES